ncbi:Pyridoxal 5'-phosphate synthase [Citrus sinensis]|uniref:Pyridoxal 5'-phosphate synthase n=3 Tax=Citrus TaxID=2706 RepID=A0ACB8MP09_CITSI|nr:pyridoxine/pyridoxamine 5'-phosphate oxidase 2 [Citrus x clementina]XP_006491309.1 pyridoxine/pyridoxamine 5'-phosphate oxidase 2 [Citrus sinensis]XP_052294812.1 pyridoxine/pyridoxamine 5'-phosphate oxidase 2-like [Citrus sinensis]ESR58047.1 hypothetical protein CICLE_v10022329mg [Citrus x clementina]KAH9731399.1 Pyridoxal 5'-phosphate synthase [Citrus sinensis]KAH9731488.1 Pyridoxal 5'-phosphate synthase [Citrus sinensis]KAH9787389.1 Pyridoxal 5'-phosphate synthase [Citrus sinensis]KDO86
MGTPVTAPWKQLLLQALESQSHLKHSIYFQLATVGTNGRPSNRTVVFRGFQDNTDKIQINSDTRSRKIEELKSCPFSEICWYFTESWDQFRINGRVDVIDGSNSDPEKLQIREKSWFGCSMKARLQYLDPEQGCPSVNEQPKEFSLDPCAGPVDAFCVLILDPDQVDYLNLKSNQKLKFMSRLSDNGEKYWASLKTSPEC